MVLLFVVCVVIYSNEARLKTSLESFTFSSGSGSGIKRMDCVKLEVLIEIFATI